MSNLVDPSVRLALLGETRPVQLRTCISRQGVVFIWPVPLPAEDGRTNRWHETARTAAGIGENSWIRLVSNMSAGGYDVYEAQGAIPDPEWPDRSFRDLLEIAFGKDRLIDREDHPVIRQLLGAA